ncbi:cell division cycle protein 20 homolog B-like [Acanthopagrus schlegelii]
MRLKTGDSGDWDNMRRRLRDHVGKRGHCPFKAQSEQQVSYRRFRRRIIQRSSREGPAASTPLTTGRRCEPSFEFDPVCQRLELDSPPPRHHGPEQRVIQGHLQETALAGGLPDGTDVAPPTVTAQGSPAAKNAPEQGFVWRASAEEHANAQRAGSDDRREDLQPFALLDEASVSPQGQPAMKLAAPSLLNDYYANLLDCSSYGLIALALGSSVFIWDSETRALVGCLDPGPGRASGHQGQSISCLCWSRDGRALCIGTRRGDIQLWDVEQRQNMSRLSSHLSAVRALSWKQQLLSSGSALGHIHHLDPRAPTPLVGAAAQEEAICSLQWSPGGDRLASGSTDGLLSIWDGDVTGLARSRQPIATMKQPSAVKAMGWCPWQRKMIATGGGWKDGVLRIWDTDSGTCVTSANTNSQICALRWAEKKKYLVTGHGLPQHHVTCWTWEFPSLSPNYQLTVVCHDLAVGQIQLQRPMSWFQARVFCQRHYIDLMVLSTEEQYFTLLNATTASKDSFWLGLQRQSTISGWKWVNGEELSYGQWLTKNKCKCHCASLEAMLENDNKLLARYCQELHMFACQGPVSPQAVTVDSVGSDHLILSWNISTLMRTTPHSYNVTTCTNKCDTLVYPYSDGSASMSISVSNLTSASEYFIEISAFVHRPDSVTGRDVTLRSKPTALHVKPASLAFSGSQQKIITVILKWLKLMSLAPPLWILYRILIKCKPICCCELQSESDSDCDVSEMELSAEETIVEMAPRKTRGVG